MIHSTAIIDKSAEIDRDVEIGPYVVIGKNTKIKDGTRIGSHSVVECAEIGKNCRIFSSAFIGTAPQDLKYKGEPTKLILGDNCIVRECVTLNRGSAATNITQIGSDCLFMAYSHVGHDCVIGSNVILANAATCGGHVSIGDFSIISALVAIHQFSRVGKYVMLSGGAMATLDIPHFCTAQGDRAKLFGLNIIGLKRHGFTDLQIKEIKAAYKTFFMSGLTVAEALSKIETTNPSKEVKDFADFIKESKRGVTRPALTDTNSLE